MAKYRQVGLSADWSVEAYVIKSVGDHDIMVFDRDDTGIFWSVVRVNKQTDGEDISSSFEVWYEDENNWKILKTFEALEEAFKYAERL
jgi:hypothetical protein